MPGGAQRARAAPGFSVPMPAVPWPWWLPAAGQEMPGRMVKTEILCCV